MDIPFLAMIFRMKYINRWSLMDNRRIENLSEHTLECAFIVHLLAVIGNKFCGKVLNPERLTIYALFHDATEILTGDLPTPVKYYDDDIKASYKKIEEAAAKKIITFLPPDLRNEYSEFLLSANLSEDEQNLIKVADKLCAYIKAKQEVLSGNKEFISAENRIKADLNKNQSPELQYFNAHCLNAFFMSLDELNGVL
ncbi:MAG: 5'-deoxynucleotidase [Eubacterium sp.]|jgi:5'-deoxynucleotidase|nr:5'-deoxynucleotidase [Eubacterium sp.]